MSSAVPLTTEGIDLGPVSGVTYRMRANDTTLARVVYWSTAFVDAAGVAYLGPGPLTDIVVSNVIGQEIIITVPVEVQGVETMPELWAQANVAANQTGVALSALVSTSFDTVKMIRAGSITGLGTRLTQAITAGTLTVRVTKNGSPGTLSVVHTTGTGGNATQAPGIDTYIAGDLIGVQLTTTSGFLPNTTDLEAWLEMLEGP